MKPATPIERAHRRDRQLDAISTIVALALFLTIVMLVYFFSASGVSLPGAVPLADDAARGLVAGLVVLLLVYVADQRRRLRAEVDHAIERAEEHRRTAEDAARMLTFSHASASALADEGLKSALGRVLAGAAEIYRADASAVVGQEIEAAFMSSEVPEHQARRALMLVALRAAGQGKPMLIDTFRGEDGQAISVPLRVNGELRFVLCMWNRDRVFQAGQLESLGLIGRMLELAMEREELITEARSKLDGTLAVLQHLVSSKRPDYAEHAMRVSNLAAAVGMQMQLTPADRRALGLAGLLHDVGIVTLSASIANADRPLTADEQFLVQRHARVGAEIAQIAGFDAFVQDAIAYHHERVDGSGYPEGLRDTRIPLGARILAVCEVYDSMTNRAYYGQQSSHDAAVRELLANAGRLYDRDAVRALVEVLSLRGKPVAGPPARTAASATTNRDTAAAAL